MIVVPSFRSEALRRIVLSWLMLSAVSCNETPADLREWRTSDHDHTDNPNSGQVQVDPADAGAPAPPGLEEVTLVAWQQNCTRCHGQLGRGDGPQGPMLKATNLSDAVWQSSVSDQQIARSIKEGKGAMPAFKLPDSTIDKLVKLVRMMSAAQNSAHAAAGPSAAASGSAPVASSAGSVAKPRPSATPPKPSAP